MFHRAPILSLFFFNDTATTEIYTLSLHDALPISSVRVRLLQPSLLGTARTPSPWASRPVGDPMFRSGGTDRKSTRLNSSHSQISYAVFCLKKKISSMFSAVIADINTAAPTGTPAI